MLVCGSTYTTLHLQQCTICMYTCSLHIQIIHNQSLFLANFVIISSARLLWVDLLLQHSHTRAKPHLPVSCYHIHAARLFVVATLAIINMPQFAYIRLLGWVFTTYTVAYVAYTFSLSFSPPLGLLVRVCEQMYQQKVAYVDS